MTRTDDAQPSSRREARELERRRPRVSVPSVRPSRGAVATTVPAAVAPAKKKQSRRRGVMHSLMSMGAMTGVAAMLISTSISGNTFGSLDPAEASALSSGEVVVAEAQSLAVVAASGAAATDVVRDSYSAKAYVPPVPVVRFAQARTGASANFNYTNNPAGSIQWPFPNPVPITYGFGPRNACSYCSTYHLGVDFVPGAGVPIQSIADGVVSLVNTGGGSFGNYVIVDHLVNGQRIQSLYAHMQWGSIQVAQGQQIGVGTVIGAVGSTGASTGAHLHLEIHADGTPIDPFAWLKANAN